MAESALRRNARGSARRAAAQGEAGAGIIARDADAPGVAGPACEVQRPVAPPPPLRILPDHLLRTDAACTQDRRIWFSGSLFAALPAMEDREHLLFSVIDQPQTPGGALELRCTRPAGLAWMTVEFLFGAAFAAQLCGRAAVGLRLRAKALPAITITAKCAFHTVQGDSIIDFAQTLYVSHEYNLFERELTIAGTGLEEAGEAAEPRIFLTMPQSAYFALVISHAELYLV